MKIELKQPNNALYIDGNYIGLILKLDDSLSTEVLFTEYIKGYLTAKMEAVSTNTTSVTIEQVTEPPGLITYE